MVNQTLDELLEEVNGYVQQAQDSDYFVVDGAGVEDVPADDEAVTEIPEGVTEEDVERIVQETLDDRAASSDVSALVEMTAAQQYGYLPNLSSSQMTYFEGVMAAHPFADYYAIYDGDQTYSLYYGYGLKESGGQSCKYVKITYSSYSQYTIDKGETAAPSVNAGQATYCSYVDSCARFPRVEVIKYETFTAAAVVCALGLWLLGKLFFR